MQIPTLDQIKQYAVYGLLASLVTVASAWAMRERTWTKTSETYSATVTKLSTQAADSEVAKRTVQAQLESSQREAREASSFRSRHARTGPDGKALLDGRGKPIYDFDEGTSSKSETEQLMKAAQLSVDSYQRQIETLHTENVSLTQRALQAESKTSKAGFKFFSGGLTWDFPWDGITDSGRARLGVYAGPNFLVGALVLRSSIGIVLPPFGQAFDIQTSSGRLGLGTDF